MEVVDVTHLQESFQPESPVGPAHLEVSRVQLHSELIDAAFGTWNLRPRNR